MKKYTDKEVFDQRFQELNSDLEQKNREVAYDGWLTDYEKEKEMPKAQTKLFDMTEKFPIEDNFTDIVIADLSIHYFTKDVTKAVIAEIRRILKPNGVFLFRVNSTKDSKFISRQNKMEEEFFWEERESRSKRCFDEKTIGEFFAEWKIEKIKEEKMLRYGKEKILWNCAVRKV